MDDIASLDIIGNPEIQVDFSETQLWNDTCAVSAETSIIRQFGFDINQGDAAYISASNGWYHPGSGTSPDDVGNLMEEFGISSHTKANATVEDLARELQAGHGIVIGVRSDQLWRTEDPMQELINFLAKLCRLDTSEYMPADHAITVTGISRDGSVVYINDSGVPDGGAQEYPLGRFLDAWENGNFTYTATDAPLPTMLGNNAPFADIDFSKWIPTGAAFITSALSGSVEAGVIAGDLLESLMNSEDFVKMI